MEVTPEIEPRHHHAHGGHWIDYVLGGAAIVISLASLYLGVRNAEHMERLVTANSYPDLSFESGNGVNANDHSRSHEIFAITNNGIGPARIKTLELFYHDKPVDKAETLIKLILDGVASDDANAAGVHETSTAPVLGSLVPPRESIKFVAFINLPADAPATNAITRGRLSYTRVRICYCSIFDECFVRDSAKIEPERTEQCTPSQPIQFHEYEPESYWKPGARSH